MGRGVWFVAGLVLGVVVVLGALAVRALVEWRLRGVYGGAEV